MTDKVDGSPLLTTLGVGLVMSLLLAAASVFVNSSALSLRTEQGRAAAAMAFHGSELMAEAGRVMAGESARAEELTRGQEGLADAHRQLSGIKAIPPLTPDAVGPLAADFAVIARIKSAVADLLRVQEEQAALPDAPVEPSPEAEPAEGGEAGQDADYHREQLRERVVATARELERLVKPVAARARSLERDLVAPAPWWLSPWVPLGLLGLALLMVIGAVVAHRADDRARAATASLAEQNARNQEAILRLLDELTRLADGDLTVQATVTEDITGAIADSINFAVEAMRELVLTINDSAIQVDSATKQTEATAAHLAKASEQQSDQIGSATESVSHMAASIEQVAGNAERSSDVARHSVEVAHKGGDAVRRTIDGMNTIRETIQETSKRIKRLGESSQEIGNIVELINDIAEQTNILALNASIQASMAGEAGRGFAVVADEVQRLAERSANATKQIEALVRTIQADTNEAVVSMERSTTDVVGGALLAENAGAALEEIEQVSNQIASLVGDISGTARQLKGASGDIASNMSVLREIASQTADSTSATSASITKLSQLSSQMRTSVSGFTLPESASRSGAYPRPNFPPEGAGGKGRAS